MTVEGWTIRDANDLYQIQAWGIPYFDINDKGHVTVTPAGSPSHAIDLKDLVDDLIRRGLTTPLLIRFSDILKHRITHIHECFERAIREYAYHGAYRAVMPIKVNQQRHVVEEIIEFGRPFHTGLEAGSKPELLIALAMVNDPEAFVICNGYKDSEYLTTALYAKKLGKNFIIVIDRFAEVAEIIRLAQKMNVRPRIGVRAKLRTKGSGKWVESAGDRSKFGLTALEVVQAVQSLKDAQMLDCLELLHFHIGSQITSIGPIKNALRECCRIYTDLVKLGAKMGIIDVGGGLAVDYDGSRTNFHSSKNYDLQEYANDVISAICAACDEARLAHPLILSESGRAMVAHHAVLVFNVLGVNALGSRHAPAPAGPDGHPIHDTLYQLYNSVTRKNYQEAYHDLLEAKDEAATLFMVGDLDLAGRARAEELIWSCGQKILKTIRELEYVPDDLESLPKSLSDTYYCNFSVFQSMPDHWAIKQLFPVMPIHRLKEKPNREATIVDLTCDSDGKIDHFIDLHDVKTTISLHEIGDEPYYIGVFLVGAYQEILGDLHNLFGDTNAVHVSLSNGSYRLDHVVQGDTVRDVVGYVQYNPQELVNKVRTAAEYASSQNLITLEEVRQFMSYYESGMSGYTYLEDE